MNEENQINLSEEGPGSALMTMPETEVVVQDKQWLKPWHWFVGVSNIAYIVWIFAEMIRFLRGKEAIVPKNQARRINFLQLLKVSIIVMAMGPEFPLVVQVISLGLLVFLIPSDRDSLKKLNPGS